MCCRRTDAASTSCSSASQADPGGYDDGDFGDFGDGDFGDGDFGDFGDSAGAVFDEAAAPPDFEKGGGPPVIGRSPAPSPG